MICYEFITKAGRFRIIQTEDGRWQACFEDEGLGSYTTPQIAAENLSIGHVFWPSCGNPQQFGIPCDIAA